MERRKYTLRIENFLWVAGIIQFSMFTTATNITTVSSQIAEDPGGSYAWSSWGSWSACSRSCGGGVSIQERHCLPRSPIAAPNGTLPPPVITVRITRQTRNEDCSGADRRYHQCNIIPCPGGSREMRVEQCSSYNYRPFRGRFYTWVPYIDGDSPCTLNCRPLGQQFYASLALAADGTPCTKPGFRAICVQGTCKVVGRDTVLAMSGTREVRCGRRLVSGLFSRPRLPLGYSYVTTVPRGACRLNVSEIVPSDNYIALKISNGSYIMNGEFAVSAPGTYEAAGARFLYSRAANRDTVFALGPIHHPVDIMVYFFKHQVLYTQPNPSIKYEYFTESPPGEVDIESITTSDLPDVHATPPPKHVHRHHTFDPYARTGNRHPDLVSMSKEVTNDEGLEENVVGTRRFIWKILSYTQCSRSCGGGIQVGKYRCVESSGDGDREVSPVHCAGSPPAGRRRRCGSAPCAPRWRAAAWSVCPHCGPALRTRIVGCVQDHSRGIIKINDQKCPAPKPPTSESCDIPDCEEVSVDVKRVETKRVIRPREHIDHFHDGPVYTVSVNASDTDIGPKYSFSAVAGWLYTDWSECVGWCVGGGVQSRGARCADPAGCVPRAPPETVRSCTPKLACDPHEGQWFTGEWSECSARCGGKQVRGVVCVGGGGRRLRDAVCVHPRPPHTRDCAAGCTDSAADWYYGDWGQCTGNCSSGTGLQRRTVVCARGVADTKGAASDADCAPEQPRARRICTPSCTDFATHSLPPDIPIESQKASGNENSFTVEATTEDSESKDCEDKLNNCVLAVQARLCHYNYYITNCCKSCSGR